MYVARKTFPKTSRKKFLSLNDYSPMPAPERHASRELVTMVSVTSDFCFAMDVLKHVINTDKAKYLHMIWYSNAPKKAHLTTNQYVIYSNCFFFF